MIDLKRKLTSRKFWLAIIGFVTPLIIAFGGSAETAEQVAALIMAGATVVAYIFAEGFTDAANVDNAATVEAEQAEADASEEN